MGVEPEGVLDGRASGRGGVHAAIIWAPTFAGAEARRPWRRGQLLEPPGFSFGVSLGVNRDGAVSVGAGHRRRRPSQVSAVAELAVLSILRLSTAIIRACMIQTTTGYSQ